MKPFVCAAVMITVLTTGVRAEDGGVDPGIVPEGGRVPRAGIPDLAYSAEEIAAASLEAAEIAGSPVFDADGRVVGAIEDVVLDLSAGYIPYLVIRYRLEDDETAERIVPVPMDFLFYDQETGGFSLATEDDDLLVSAPSYDELRGRVLQEEAGKIFFARPLVTYWTNAGSIFPTWRGPEERLGDVPGYEYAYGGGMRVFPRSLTSMRAITGFPVTDAGGAAVGTIGGFSVNAITGEIEALTFEYDGERRRVPLAVFTLNPLAETVTTNVPARAFREAPVSVEDADRYWSGLGSVVAIREGMRYVPRTYLEAEELEGFRILDRRRRAIGSFEDVLVNPGGDVSYAVIGLSEAYGFMGDLALVPFGVFSIDPVNNVVLFPGALAPLREMPVFRADDTPGMLPAGWTDEFDRFWTRYFLGGDREDDAAVREAGPSFFADFIEGRPVYDDPEGNPVGEIEGLLLDLEDGRIASYRVETGGILGVAEETLEIAPDRLRYDPELEGFVRAR